MSTNRSSKRRIPAELLKCAKLPTMQKLAIFKDRQTKILTFLANEDYSTLKNITALLDTYKQTALRILKRLCNEQYIAKYTIEGGYHKDMVIYQISNTGLMLVLKNVNVEKLPHLQQLPNSRNDSSIPRHLQLQEIRIKLQNVGYTQFQKPRQLLQANHPLCGGTDKTTLYKTTQHKIQQYKIPEYFCLDSAGNKVAIEYETIIQSNQEYQQIIASYVKAINAGVIDKVLFFTRIDFVDNLNVKPDLKFPTRPI